ncbi:MAG: M48 family metallopeptidase [Methylophilaceae bacterium]|nr:M48 family metallopeptidase [Methylophilaceae bacterium]
MTATACSILFVCLLAATLFIQQWLGWRQIRHITAHREAVPAAFSSSISLQAHQKAADYNIAKIRLRLYETATQTLLLLVLTLGGFLQWLDSSLAELLQTHPLWHGGCVIVVTFIITALVDIPFDYYRTFVIDARFDFNKMTPAMFFQDVFKHAVIGLVLGLPLLVTALWLMQSAGHTWWLWLWCVWAVFNLFILAIYPTFIAPLFNRFSPLTDESLKIRIEALLAKCGFRSQGLFVMDGSRRSSHGNAYFTGLGASKRVVFFDTLLERLNADEIEAVLAHELGHHHHHHVIKRIIMMFVTSFAGLALLGWLKQETWFYAGLGVSTPSDHMALLLFLLISPVLTFILRPLFAAYARQNEFEADAYAARHSNAKHLIEALVKLYRDNASTLTPDPLHSAFYDSHPPASIRIARLEKQVPV